MKVIQVSLIACLFVLSAGPQGFADTQIKPIGHPIAGISGGTGEMLIISEKGAALLETKFCLEQLQLSDDGLAEPHIIVDLSASFIFKKNKKYLIFTEGGKLITVSENGSCTTTKPSVDQASFQSIVKKNIERAYDWTTKYDDGMPRVKELKEALQHCSKSHLQFIRDDVSSLTKARADSKSAGTSR